jgi:hypothetical protein
MTTPQPPAQWGQFEHCKFSSLKTTGSGKHWVMCDKVVGDCIWIIDNNLCPTRPHTPALEQCKHWVSSANLKSDCRDQDIGRFYCNKSMYEHDTAIRNATLDEVILILDSGFAIRSKIQSLRTQEQP